MKYFSLFSLAAVALSLGCGSKPTSTAAVPSWVRQPARTFSNGRITFVESDDDTDADRARAKAEGLALQDLANECTLVPKGARIDDRFEIKTAHLYQAHLKVVVDAQHCENAKHALTPEAIRLEADSAMTVTVKAFQDVYGEPVLNLAASKAVVHDRDDSSFGSDLSTARPSSMPPPSDEGEIRAYFIQRQRIAQVKQLVVITSNGEFKPGVTQATRLANELARGGRAFNTFEGLHPDMQTWTRSWSRYRRELLRPQYGSSDR